MSDQDNLFKEGEPHKETPDVKPEDLLSGIKNEHGEQKYKSVEDALKALKNAQEFIPTLLNEKQELSKKYEDLEEKVKKVDALEQTLLELSNKKNDEADDRKPVIPNPEGITKQMLEDYLSEREQTAAQQNNLKAVVEAVKKAHGDDAEKVFYGKATELGMSNDEINSLAAKNPKLILKLLDISGDGANRQPTRVAPSGSEINTSGLKGREIPVITRSEKSVLFGAKTFEVRDELDASLKMAESMHESGMYVSDLSNPSLYFKTLGKKG